MILGLYVDRRTPIHALPPAAKLAALAAAGIGVFLVADPVWLAALLAGVVGLMAVARVPLAQAAHQLRPIAILLAVIFVVHGVFTTWEQGLVVALRFAALLLLALVVTFTTRVSAMIETLERALRPLAAIGVNPSKVSLTLSMALRFIPLIAARAVAVREAQRARGLERNLVALVMPLLVKTLRMANDLSDAIEARGYDPDRRGGERTL